MGIFSFLGNLGAGIQGHRMGKKQMQLGQGMIDEAQALSAAYDRHEMMTPQAIQTMMDISRGMQFENMPGLTTMQNQIDKATAGGVSAIERMTKGSEGIGAIADLYASQMDEQANLGKRALVEEIVYSLPGSPLAPLVTLLYLLRGGHLLYFGPFSLILLNQLFCS